MENSNNNQNSLYDTLLKECYEKNPPITLPAEYAYFIKDNLLRLLIRLARYKFVAKIIKKNDLVLEVGCGSGLGAIFLSQYCREVNGVDISELEIKEANSINRRSNVKFSLTNFYDIPPEKNYDIIVSLDVIEHLQESEGEKLVARTCQHLKPDGMLILGTPSIYSYEYQGELSKAAHVKCYDQQELLDLIDKYYGRTLPFSMNDELVHTGFAKMAWYYFVLAFIPGRD